MRAVYCATRNLYPRLVTTVNSLLTNNPNIEVTLILEDRKVPCLEHPRVRIETVDKYTKYFDFKSPNLKTYFTYMACIRLSFFKEMTGKVLYLDVDTVVDQNIEPLFEMDMEGKAVAGVTEIQEANHIKTPDYMNTGVLLMNLDYIRESGAGDEMLERINSDTLCQWPDQDVLNIVCDKHEAKIVLPSEYNEFCMTNISDNPKIVHFAGQRNWWLKASARNEYYAKYKCISLKYCS